MLSSLLIAFEYYEFATQAFPHVSTVVVDCWISCCYCNL
jgi:hypothetical protein